MPTLRTVTVKASGGDYSSLAAAFAGETGNLVALDQRLNIACDAISDGAGAPVNAGSAWTTDATRYVLTYAAQNHQGLYGGVGGNSAYAMAVGSSLRYSIPYSVVRGLSVDQIDNGFPGVAGVVFDRVIAKHTGFAAGGFTFYASGTAVNCLALALSFGGGFSVGGNGTVAGITGTLYNCTAYSGVGGATGFEGAGCTVVAKNCDAIGFGTGFDDAGTTTWTGSSTCASSDAHVPTSGTGHRASQSFSLVDASSGDYRLKADDTGAKGYGTDLSSDPTYPFSTDLIGATRSAPWDIGAYKFLAAGVWSQPLDLAPFELNGPFTAASAATMGPDIAPFELAPFSTAAVATSFPSDLAPWEIGPWTASTSGTPGVGVLTVTGFAPTGVITSPMAVGALTATGLAPSATVTTVPGVGSLTLTGLAPSTTTTSTAGVGSLTLTGLAPSSTVTTFPGAGALTLTGSAPSGTVTGVAGLGALTLSGLAPSSSVAATLGVGSLTITGQAPSGAVIETPDVGSLTLTGLAPSASLTAPSDVGALTVDGFAPLEIVTTTPDAGALVLDGFAPTNIIAVVSTPGTGALTLDAFAPSAALTTTLGVGSLAIDAMAPRGAVTEPADVGAADLTGLAPTAAIAAHADVGALTIDAFAPASIITGSGTTATDTPGTGEITIDGFAPTGVLVIPQAPAGAFRSIASISTRVGALTVEGHAPTTHITPHITPRNDVAPNNDVPTPAPITSAPDAGAWRIEGFAPTGHITSTPGMGRIVMTTVPPRSTVTARPGTGEGRWRTHAPISTIYAPTPRAAVEALVASIDAPGVGVLALVGHAPDNMMITAEDDDDVTLIAALYVSAAFR